MAPKKRPPQAPPGEAPGRKKRTQETTQQATDAGPSVRHTRQRAAGAGSSVQPAGPSVPTSRQKKAAKRPRGEPKKPLNPDAIEGEYLVKFEHIADRERHVRWCHVTSDQRRSALRAVRNRDLTAFGLSVALDLPVHRPHISSCLEFIHSAVTVDPREGVSPLDLPMEATVRGRTVRLDAALVRAAFVLPAASLEIKRQVRHSLIVDWFREYERNGKRYIARTCLHREWAPAVECICMVLLASRRPQCIPGRLVYYIKKFKMDPEDVLLVDTSPERNSLNDPYSAVHPRAVDKFPSAAASSAWLLRFTDWLATWTESLLPTVDFVHSHGHVLDGLTDPFLVLREFWGETPQPIDRAIIWGEVPQGRYLYLTTKWPDFFFHRENPAEEPPAEGAGHVEEAPVEGPARVEEAATVQEAGHVEKAPVEGPARVEEAAPVQEAVHVEEAPVEGAAPVKEPTRVEEAPAEGLTSVEDAPAMGLTQE
ncbi:hypothetical protein R1sor_008634 [Riccia sorocarpa]|uniref:Uncharacterized protein n=1 Tax=Riccia sorocarpa TaxID=122646 RepID=A0ABD3HU10_9MARC